MAGFAGRSAVTAAVVRGCAAALALLGAVACDSSPPEPRATSPAPSGDAFTVPPLWLPAVAAGAPCPVTSARPWTGPGQAGRVLGDGPVHPVADYLGGEAVLELRPGDRRPDGAYEKKVRWIAAGYTGPVLVRAARIDAPGAAGVTFSYVGEPRDGGHHAVLTRENSDLPATTTVAGPGCYAYQVDGVAFSGTIVFRAVLQPSPRPALTTSRE
ncbi:hypothetical protein MB27_33250 [Actinoplanes utahensis]|uniref:Lipoprotein n=1 Tax=Actinoplanes utahensis TaxID=1869 RepID=A0A0A6UDT1_ACTUT|nr:hypothetical protein MB27_33250 [Actinoplanes utahensis]